MRLNFGNRALPASIVRPWYVLGPGHRWPVILKPLYWLGEKSEATREVALRFGLVTLEQITRALVWAAENPPVEQVRVIDVPSIRARAN